MDALDSFSINFFEANGVKYNRVEITTRVIFYYLSSNDWGELGYFRLNWKGHTVTELIVDYSRDISYDLVSVFNQFPENVRSNLKKSPDFPSQLLNSKHDDAITFHWKIMLNDKAARFTSFIVNLLNENRKMIVDEINSKYQAQLRVQFNISKPVTPELPKKRRGGPIPTPDEEKDKMIDEWEKSKGTITIEAFCRKKHIGVSTFGGWRRDRKNRNRPPLT